MKSGLALHGHAARAAIQGPEVIKFLRRRPVAAILVAVAAQAAVAPAKVALNAFAGGDVGMLVPMTVVIAAAWMGGLGPGVAATIAGIAIEDLFFTNPVGSLAVAAERDWIRLLLLGVAGSLSSWLIWHRLDAEVRATRLREEALGARDQADLLARRLRALQELGSQLAQQDATEEIVRLLVRHGKESLLAHGAAAYLMEPDGRRIRLVDSRGDAQGQTVLLADFDIDADLPWADVARTGEPIFIEDPAAYAARYGASFADLGLDAPAGAVAAVPIEFEGRRFGTFFATWNEHWPLPPDRQAFVVSLARVAAIALDRARLLGQERSAFQRLASAQHRLDLVAEAGRVFGLSLDYESTLRRVASLAVPMLGDVCAVDVFDGEAVRRLVAVATDSLAGPAAVLEQHPIDLTEDCPVVRVLETGEALTYSSDTREKGYRHHSPEHATALRVISAKWHHLTPLRTLDQTIGVLTFMRREDRTFDGDEVAMASEVADRAVHAIQNARLHRQVRRLAERETRRAAELEAVLGAVNEGFVLVDSEGFVQSSNAAAARLLGEQVPTFHALLDRLVGPGEAAPDSLPEGPTEYRLRHRPSAWVEVTAYQIASPDARAPSTVVVCRDVTAFRQGQALRQAFLGLLSHELRTPVTTIYGGAAVLTRPGGHLDTSTAGEVLGDIAAEADRLYRLVEDLLVLARFDEGLELGADPVLLQRLVPNVVAQEQGRWPGVNFEVDLRSDLPAVSGDETSITQVVRNLLSNASKYSGAPATVRLVVEPDEHGVAVRVLDEGPGIDPGEADHLFDAFYRSPTTATLAGGAGIGLYVSRRLIDAMGGRIWARRRTGRGSEFAFVLPPFWAEDEPG